MKGKKLFEEYIKKPDNDIIIKMLGECIRINKPVIYGWHVDPSISDPAQACDLPRRCSW